MQTAECMKLSQLHPWDVPPKEAIAIQNELRNRITLHDDLGAIKYVAGIDVGFENSGRTTRAAVVLLEYPSLELVEVSVKQCRTVFPYIPGLLSFRELPAVIKAMEKLAYHPDLLLCDGQGRAHPRRFGIACHLGLLADIPSVGVGKTRLCGTHDPVAEERGAWRPLLDKGEIIGAVVRTRTGVKPVYISAGHRISLHTAIDYVLNCTTRFKLPETIRQAHKYASDNRITG